MGPNKLHFLKSFPPTLHPLSVSVSGMDPEMLLKGTAQRVGAQHLLEEDAQYPAGEVDKREDGEYRAGTYCCTCLSAR